MAYPVRTVSVPAVLAGRQNGSLPPDILLDTPGLAGGPTVRLVRPAARAWRALTAAAAAAGHTLKSIDSYRPYDTQERIFLQRFTTTPVSSTRRTWRGQTWYLRPGMALAAVPGTSNHGLGLAVDTGEESDGDTGIERLDQGTLAWLLANEERFGFSHEVQSEPWHIRYFSGDHIPAAVLDHEGTPPPTQEDDDMAGPPYELWRLDGDLQVWRTDGLTRVKVTAEAIVVDQLRGLEIKVADNKHTRAWLTEIPEGA